MKKGVRLCELKEERDLYCRCMINSLEKVKASKKERRIGT